MRNKAYLFVSFFLLSTTAGSCGGGGGGGGGLGNICASDGVYVDLINKAYDCQPSLELIFGVRPSATELATACSDSFQPFVDNGTVTVDSSALDACLAWIATTSCDTFDIESVNPCQDVFVGTQPLGSACDITEQCEGATYCDVPTTGCGTCTELVLSGDACSAHAQCETRLCSFDRCKPKGGIGDSCLDDSECSGPAVCSGVTDTCEPAPTFSAGDPCTNASECGVPLAGLYCDNTNCIAIGSVGSPCTNPSECDFLAFERCDVGVTDQCLAPTIVNLGDACGQFEGLKCADSLLCNNSVCETIDTAGSSCADDGSCNQLLLECVAGQCQYGEHTGMCSGA